MERKLKLVCPHCKRDYFLLCKSGICKPADAFFEEDDGYVLLDYKTDYIKEGEEEEFINKYRIQIELYEKTLNKILGEDVKESYLYSFYLEKELKIK